MAVALTAISLHFLEAGEPKTKAEKKANLLIDISGRAINAVVQRSVDRTEPVQETILDTPVHGMSRTLAHVWAELNPSPTHGVVDVVFRGNVYSRTVSTRPFVLISTIGTTPVEVRKRVVMDSRGIGIFAGPTSADTTIQLLDVSSRTEPDYLAIRFARQGFLRNQGEAEVETACKTAQQIASGLEKELTPPLKGLSESGDRGLRTIKRLGLTLESLDFSTSATFIQGSLRIATPGRGASGPIPPMPADIDVGVRVHQSLVNEAAELTYGGRTFALEAVDNFYEEVTQGLLRDGRKDSEKRDGLKKLQKALADLAGKPTTITLTKKDPLILGFADQGFTIEVRLATINQEDVTYAGSRVKASYRFENTKEGVHLVRQGPVQVIPAKAEPEKKIEPASDSVRLFQEILFAEIMNERLILSAVPPPEMAAKLGFLAPRAGAADGWFGLAWGLK